MSAPRRLVEEGGTAEERALLLAAIEEDPPEGALDRALAAAGLGAAAASGVAAGAAGKGAASPWTWLLGGKVLLACVVSGGIVAGAMRASRGAGAGVAATPAEVTTAALPAASVSAPPAASAAEVAAPVGAEGGELVPAGTEAAAPARATAGASRLARATTSAEPAPDTMSAQIAAVDGARRVLAGGNATGALARLDRYERDFPRGAFGQEITVLRIEALLRAGDRAAATTLGRRFLAGHARSPLAGRVSAMLDRTAR